jgi:hypothetical protein
MQLFREISAAVHFLHYKFYLTYPAVKPESTF